MLWLDHSSTFTGKVADFGAQESIDLPGILFGHHTTLGYSENSRSRMEPTSRKLRFSATTWPRALSRRPTTMVAR
jgi:hypothetical protein